MPCTWGCCKRRPNAAAGGIHDQVGGGFARYSTDAFWHVPHFEKMLYDNALPARAYLHGWLVSHEPRYRRVIEDTIGYVLRDLGCIGLGGGPTGVCYAAQDADSEGEEGHFYLWDRAEIEDVCGDDACEVARYFGVTERGSFESRNILRVADRTEEPPAEVRRALPLLLEHRSHRERPGLDDKVLLGWNALFVRALAEAAAALERDDWMATARGTAPRAGCRGRPTHHRSGVRRVAPESAQQAAVRTQAASCSAMAQPKAIIA